MSIFWSKRIFKWLYSYLNIWREKHSTPHLSNISLVMIPPPPLPSVAKILAASRHTTPPPAIPTHLKIWCALRRPCNPNDLPILHPKLVLPPAQKNSKRLFHLHASLWSGWLVEFSLTWAEGVNEQLLLNFLICPLILMSEFLEWLRLQKKYYRTAFFLCDGSILWLLNYENYDLSFNLPPPKENGNDKKYTVNFNVQQLLLDN